MNRPLPGLALTALFLVACPIGEFEYDDDATICGTITWEGDACDEPLYVEVATVADGESTCRSDTGFYRSWVDEVVDQPEVIDGTYFQSKVDPGEYGVYVLEDASGGDCYDCEGATASSEGCAEVNLEVRFRVPADAPNIYLYPEEPSAVKVRLPRPERITASDPPYPDHGWEVLAFPDGQLATIDGPRDYLFYEVQVPASDFQRRQGWCVEGHLAQASIETAMEHMGFLDHEIADFSEFWDASFPIAPWITVYPQRDDELTWLRIRPEPDHLLRAWFVIDAGCHPTEPALLEPMDRSGYHAAEWGLAALPPLKGADQFVQVW